MFSRDSQELAARKIAEIKRQLAERKNPQPTPPAPSADDDDIF